MVCFEITLLNTGCECPARDVIDTIVSYVGQSLPVGDLYSDCQSKHLDVTILVAGSCRIYLLKLKLFKLLQMALMKGTDSAMSVLRLLECKVESNFLWNVLNDLHLRHESVVSSLDIKRSSVQGFWMSSVWNFSSSRWSSRTPTCKNFNLSSLLAINLEIYYRIYSVKIKFVMGIYDISRSIVLRPMKKTAFFE